MAPPIPLATVAGTLALSFTAGRAATTLAPPVQVPTPPSLPPVPGESGLAETAETSEPSETAETSETSEPAEPPEPEATVQPVQPVQPVPPAFDEVERPGEPSAPESKRLLRPNTRPLMFNLFVGGSKALRGGYSYFGNDLAVEGAIGGFGPSFRAGGFAVVQMTKGFPFTTFTLAPRLSLNRQIVPDHAIYLTTNLTVGYRASTYRDSGTQYVYDGYNGQSYGSSNDRTTYHSAVMSVGWGASAILAERLVLSFRPAEFELVVPGPIETVQLNWTAMAGIGLVWGGPNDRDR